MRVLSIDLDYIMGPSIELYNSIYFDPNSTTRWRNLFEKAPVQDHNIFIDQNNLLYIAIMFF